jgi:hypothetical protein
MRTAPQALLLFVLTCAAVAQAEDIDLELEDESTPALNDLSFQIGYIPTLFPAVAHGARLQVAYHRFFGESASLGLGYRMGGQFTPFANLFYLGLEGLAALGPPGETQFLVGPTVELGLSREVLVTFGIQTAIRLGFARHFALELPLEVQLMPVGSVGAILALTTGVRGVFPF